MSPQGPIFNIELSVKARFYKRRSKSHKTAEDSVKIENRSRNRNQEFDGVGVGRIKRVHAIFLRFYL